MIPKSISEISNEWIEELAFKLLKIETESLKISSLSINTSNCSDELFECCNLSVTFEENQKSQKWLIKLVPTDPDLRDIVLRHDLFKKELLIHQLVIPELQTFVHTKLGNKNIGTLPHISSSGNAIFSDSFEGFPIPQLLHGEYDDQSKYGIMVFASNADGDFSVADPDLKRISSEGSIERVICRLASFHAICTAYEQSCGPLDIVFPFLAKDRGNIWFQDDMSDYLEEMYTTCLHFLKSIPGQENTCQWFEKRMKSMPEDGLLQNSILPRTLVHGDLWHNNIYFNSKNQVIFGSWQMCHLGSAAMDLCFFLCSSTTTSFRKDHWDRIIHFYYQEFSQSILRFSSNSQIPSLEEFLVDVRASIPISIFFCANLRDLDTDEYSQEVYDEPIYGFQDKTAKKESIQDLHQSFGKLQNSYSLYFIRDPDLTSMKEESEDDDDDDDEGGIIITFGTSKAENYNLAAKDTKLSSSESKQIPDANNVTMHCLERQALQKVPTVATDKELEAILETRNQGFKAKKKSLDPRKARALRRKLYLDLYGEVAQRMLI